MSNFKQKEMTYSEILSILTKYEDIIVGMGTGEPDYILNMIDENPTIFSNVKIHQMLEMKNRNYIQGKYPNIRYVSYFMSGFTRKAFLNGQCDLIPNHFHQMPRILENVVKRPIIVCQVSPMDENGYFSLGTEAEYVAHFIGKAPFIIQVNEQVPKTYGENNIHISQVEALIHHNQPLHELPFIPSKKLIKKLLCMLQNGLKMAQPFK